MPSTSRPPVLLYDGDCAFCQGVVRFVLRHEKRHGLHFASRQSPFGVAALARHPGLPDIDSVVWLEPESLGQPQRVYIRSEAALRVAAYLGGWWRCAAVARLVPRRWRDGAYDRVAALRKRRPGSAQACRLPAPEARERFIDR